MPIHWFQRPILADQTSGDRVKKVDSNSQRNCCGDIECLYDRALRRRFSWLKIGDCVFTPGFTSCRNRVQDQEYDVTELLQGGLILEIMVSFGVPI